MGPLKPSTEKPSRMSKQPAPILDYQRHPPKSRPPSTYTCGSRNHLVRRQRLLTSFSRIVIFVISLLFAAFIIHVFHAFESMAWKD